MGNIIWKICYRLIIPLLIGAGLFISSSMGQKWLLGWAQSWLNHNSEYYIDYERFDGNLLTDFRFASIDVKKNNIKILSGQDLKVAWQFTKLLHKSIIIDTLEFKSLYLPNNFDTAQSKQDSQPVSFSDNKPAIIVNQLNAFNLNLVVKNLELELNFARKWYEVSGNINLPKGDINLSIQEKKNDLSFHLSSQKIDDQQLLIIADLKLNGLKLYPDYAPITCRLEIMAGLRTDKLDLALKPSYFSFGQYKYKANGDLSLTQENNLAVHSLGITSSYISLSEGKIIISGLLGQEQTDIKMTSNNFRLPDFKQSSVSVQDSLLSTDIQIQGKLKQYNVKGVVGLITNLVRPGELKQQMEINTNIQTQSNQFVLQSEINVNQYASAKIATLIPFGFNNNPVQLKSQAQLKGVNQWIGEDEPIKSGWIDADLTIQYPFQKQDISGSLKIHQLSIHDKTKKIRVEDTQCQLTITSLDNIKLNYLNGQINDGLFDVTGFYQSGDINFEYNLNNMLMDRIFTSAFKDSRVYSKGQFSGALKSPKISATANIDNIEIVGDATIQSSQLKALLTSQGDQIILDTKLIHAQDTISTLVVTTNQNNILENMLNHKLALGIKSDVNLNSISNIFLGEDYKFNGHFKSDLRLDGRINSPNMNGTLSWNNGFVEAKKQGVYLKNIKFDAIANDHLVTIKKFTANGLEEGSLDIKGNIVLSQNPTIDVTGSLTQFKIVNMEELNGYCDGQFQINQKLLDPNVSGDFTFNDVHIILATLPESSYETINTIDAKTFNENNRVVKEPAHSAKPGMIDVQLKFPHRIFIKGLGLDAELGGKIQLLGPTLKPIVKGHLNMVRGQYQFLNKKLQITRGKVWVYDKDIQLDFIAQSKANDLIVDIYIKGSPENVKISFSSTPSLPQDEILARLLFGKDITKLSPMQIAQLAYAIQQLTTIGKQGAGLDILGTTSKFLKVDNLEINGSTKDDLSVGAGKYISDKIYIKGEQGSSLQSGKVTVNVNLTDNITVESSAGADVQNNEIKIFWQKSY